VQNPLPAPASSAPPPTLLYRLTSIVDRLDFAGMFPQAQPVEIELGSGDGTFLVHYAGLHPERNFLGVERLLGRIRKLDRKGRRAGLTNLLGLRLECAYFLEYLLLPGSVSALHIYFPDPWPKKRHRARRLINERFPTIARNVLEPGGLVYLRTDDADYFAQMTEVFAASAAFRPAVTAEELASLRTDFEVDFQSKGIRTLRAAYQANPC
jgi:tRNA (guanine-N7-)-methyltransferase